MKSDQMGTGHNNPSPRELPLSNQARFRLTGSPPCERLLARYNAGGPQALGDLRRRNGASSSVLKPDLLEKLKARLLTPPPDGGLWTSPKVAAWMAGELGLAEVLPQRGWEALKAIGWAGPKPPPPPPPGAPPRGG